MAEFIFDCHGHAHVGVVRDNRSGSIHSRICGWHIGSTAFGVYSRHQLPMFRRQERDDEGRVEQLHMRRGYIN